MKKNVLMLICLAALSCSKKETYEGEAVYVEPKYDTTAIDSFSNGAKSVNVANQIKMSSKSYQDSLQTILKAQEAERKKRKTEDSIKAVEIKKEKEKAKETASPEPSNAATSN